MNILQPKKYYLLIKVEYKTRWVCLFLFRKSLWKTNKSDQRLEEKTNKSNLKKSQENF